MSEWWTYGPSDFLMFSPEAYWRLVARYNTAWWPAQLAGVAASLGVLVLLARPRAWTVRAVLLVHAAAWAWVAWAFHAERHSEIFLAAHGLAWTGAAQALLLAAAAALPRPTAGPVSGWPRAGLALVVAALLLPVLAPLTGRPWNQAEVFGWMPDPTALATLGALLAFDAWRWWLRAALAVVPVLALLLGGATRWLLA